jgi:hypothetical protein
MRCVGVLILLLLLLTSVPVFCQDLSIDGPLQAELVEGTTYGFAWNAGGAETVDILIQGARTSLGGQAGGQFEIVLAKNASAVEGEISCTLPWIDSPKITLKMIGRDGAGKKVSSGERTYRFRPAILADRMDDGIYVDLHQKANQRLYVETGGAISRMYICSSSMAYRWLPVNVHPKDPHDHAGIFKVLRKAEMVHSNEYDVDMPWAMNYLSGHFIHATSQPFYKQLGQPASHGCIRLHRQDAHDLYGIIPVGTRVEVIGPQR